MSSLRHTAGPQAGGRAPRLGFTTIELMVVVVVIGMLGGVAFMAWNAVLPNQKLNTAVRTLSEVLHEVRTKAIANSKEFQMHYDLDEETYQVLTPFRAEGGGYVTSWEDEERLWIRFNNLTEAGIEIEQITLHDKTFVDGRVMIPYGPLGMTASHTVVLRQSAYDRLFTVEVMPLTGDIRFHDGIFERELVSERDFD